MTKTLDQMISEMKKTASDVRKTRDRVKTAAPEDLGKGDLLAHTIHRMSEDVRARAFPEEVKAEKEAADRAKLAAAKKADETPPAAGAESATGETATEEATEQVADAAQTGQEAETEGEVAQEATDEPAKEASEIPPLSTLMTNPFFKKGFDEEIERHRPEMLRDLSTIYNTATL